MDKNGVCTRFDLPVVRPQKNSGESIVDIALYQPTSKRVEAYIRSGEILEDTRRLQYHTDMLENMKDIENFNDPLLYRGYDRMDLELMHKEAIEEIMQRRNPGFSPGAEAPASKNVDAEEPKQPVVNPEVSAEANNSKADSAEA